MLRRSAMVTNEGETIQRALLEELRQRRISRRRFIQNTIAAGLSVAGVGVLAGCGAPAAAPAAPAAAAGAPAVPTAAAAAPAAPTAAAAASTRPLTPTFYDWIDNLHP